MEKKIIKRINTNKIFCNNIQIGGQNKVIIQSMTNTKTSNHHATIQQINELFSYGCEIVRVAILDLDDIEALKIIIPASPIPVVADIHYKYDFAIKAIAYGVSKIRINPGNIGDQDKIKAVVNECKNKNIPIRIGINSGSLPAHIIKKYGYGQEALISAAKETISLFEKLNFHDYILSLKHVDPNIVISSYIEASKLFKCPLHIGVTEAGSLIKGSIKSTYALTKLLELGIGDTIRISLSTNPIHEIIVAKEILRILKLNQFKIPNLISCPTCGRLQYNMLPIVNEIDDFLNKLNKDINVAIIGCGVNGFGEAQNADIAVIGAQNKGLIYIKHKLIKILPENEIVAELKKIILNYKN